MRAALSRQRVLFSSVILTRSAMLFSSGLCRIFVLVWVPARRAASCTAADTNSLTFSEWLRAGPWPKTPVVYSIAVQMTCRASLFFQSGITNVKRVATSVNVATCFTPSCPTGSIVPAMSVQKVLPGRTLCTTRLCGARASFPVLQTLQVMMVAVRLRASLCPCAFNLCLMATVLAWFNTMSHLYICSVLASFTGSWCGWILAVSNSGTDFVLPFFAFFTLLRIVRGSCGGGILLIRGITGRVLGTGAVERGTVRFWNA